jgi:hypothetical protein
MSRQIDRAATTGTAGVAAGPGDATPEPVDITRSFRVALPAITSTVGTTTSSAPSRCAVMRHAPGARSAGALPGHGDEKSLYLIAADQIEFGLLSCCAETRKVPGPKGRPPKPNDQDDNNHRHGGDTCGSPLPPLRPCAPDDRVLAVGRPARIVWHVAHGGWAVVSASRLLEMDGGADIGVSWYCSLSQFPPRLTQIELDVKAPPDFDVRTIQ